MGKLKTEVVLEAMLRARFQHEGYDAAGIEKKLAEVMAFPESLNFDDYGYTYENYWDEAAMILDWIEEYEPEARAIAALLLSTPMEPKFNEGLIEDAIQEIRHRPGDTVYLIGLPRGFLDDLPAEDQLAITKIIGKPVVFAGHDKAHDQAVIKFTDDEGDEHILWMDYDLVKASQHE